MMGFKSWISNYRVSKGERYSHLGMTHFTGSYYIPEEEVSTFHKKYYEHVFSQTTNVETDIENKCYRTFENNIIF